MTDQQRAKIQADAIRFYEANLLEPLYQGRSGKTAACIDASIMAAIAQCESLTDGWTKETQDVAWDAIMAHINA